MARSTQQWKDLQRGFELRQLEEEKLASIKERANQNALSQQEWADNYRGDVQFLLQLVEKQEKALKKLQDAAKTEETLED